jgi:murein DD-endopeptidase MepM/ murein hydrolase activator NlpD
MSCTAPRAARAYTIRAFLILALLFSPALDALAVPTSTVAPASTAAPVISTTPVISTAPATSATPTTTTVSPAHAVPAAVPVPDPLIIVAPATVRQGDPLVVGFVATLPLRDLRLELRDQGGHLVGRGSIFLLSQAGGRSYYEALLALPWEARPGSAELRLSGSGPDAAFSRASKLTIEARAFPTEDVALDKVNTAIRTEPDPKKTEQAVNIQAIYARVDPGELWLDAPFTYPVDPATRRSAGFGDRRRYLYASGGSDSTWHSGIDFALPVGTPVFAPAAGRVVYSGARIVTGYTMVVEHLPGLYSVFMHLSEGIAPVGAVVKRGDRIALSGNTGLTTGPHLHWEVRAAATPVDPDWWIGRPVLDKAALERASSIDFEGR